MKKSDETEEVSADTRQPQDSTQAAQSSVEATQHGKEPLAIGLATTLPRQIKSDEESLPSFAKEAMQSLLAHST